MNRIKEEIVTVCWIISIEEEVKAGVVKEREEELEVGVEVGVDHGEMEEESVGDNI